MVICHPRGAEGDEGARFFGLHATYAKLSLEGRSLRKYGKQKSAMLRQAQHDNKWRFLGCHPEPVEGSRVYAKLSLEES